ncbi:hypothetical protein SAMN04488002_3362 [Litoreibacter janthinus]|uniref:Uncharacterized protein n=2 Tax=Litoreibacter janthinus TaxID=670154 RepID=A0A1I6HT27_9RHOB|nr:hypothetical protein SAMN04488002_3362 [Litoreibacter janthinus]
MIFRTIFAVCVFGLVAACEDLQKDLDAALGAPHYTLCGGGTSRCCDATDGRLIDGGTRLGHFCASSTTECRTRATEVFPDALDLRTDMLSETQRNEDYLDCRPVKQAGLLEQSPASPSIRFAFALHTLRSEYEAGTVRIYRADTSLPLSDPYQCKSHCEANNAFCNETNLEGEADTFQSLMEEIESVGPNGVLPKSTVMELFDQEVDDCGRGDIFFEGNTVRNAGEENCVAQIGQGDDQISLLFAKDFSASVSREDGINFTIDPQMSPVVIEHSDQTSLLNGNLTFVGMEDASITVRIGDHCIASNF